MRKDTMFVLLLLLLAGLLAGEAVSYPAKGAPLESASQQKSQVLETGLPEYSEETFKNDADDDLHYIPSYVLVPDQRQVGARMQHGQYGVDDDGDEEATGRYTGGVLAHGRKRDKRFLSSIFNRETSAAATEGMRSAHPSNVGRNAWRGVKAFGRGVFSFDNLNASAGAIGRVLL